MKIRLRPDPPGMREPNESEMNDWLANLREDEASEPADTPSDAEGEPGGAPEATATVPETDETIETSGSAEPYQAAETAGLNWGPARDAAYGGDYPLLGAPVSAVADTTDFVDADETAEPYGTAPSVTSEAAEHMVTSVVGEVHDADQRDVAAESTGVTGGASGPGETSDAAEVGPGPGFTRETWATEADEGWSSRPGAPWSPAPGELWTPMADEGRLPAADEGWAPAADEAQAPATGEPWAPVADEARAPVTGETWTPAANAAAAGRRRRLAPGGRRPQAPIETPVRALIGEEMRTPTVWCELEPGNCISWHADREALGVADVRERAIAAGWRTDALGRLTCPQCQQRSASFRTTQPVVLWSRAYALTMAAREAARQGGYQYPQPAFYPR